jgi:hypothetical protein
MTSRVADSESVEQAMAAGGSTGLIVGSALCALSLLWALLVTSGAAQSLVDTIVRWHVIHPVYVIATIEPRRVVALFLLAGMTGYAFGETFAHLWNRGLRLVRP